MVSLTFVIGSTIYGIYPTKTVVDTQSIKFKGMYGLELRFNEIEKIEVIQQIPKILKRTNGFSFLNTKKGVFELEDLGTSRLLVHSNSSPYLLISKRKGEHIILNSNNRNETLELYNLISSRLK